MNEAEPGRSPSGWLLATVFLATVFTFLLGWALIAWKPEEESIPVSKELMYHVEAATKAPTSGPSASITNGTGEPVQLEFPPGRLTAPTDVSVLLGQDFQFRRGKGMLGFAKLRSAVAGKRSITILNVWAPYCEPCKREFPGFRELQSSWGTKVQFLPIQLGEGEPGALREVMPEAPFHLIDYVPGGAVQQTLATLELLPENMPIPITLVLDCRNQLRWLQAGEVRDMTAFDGVVKTLLDELQATYCAVPAPDGGPSKSATPSPHDECGNGVCEQKSREDCDSCPEDCGCRPGQLCARQQGASGRHLCADDVE